MGTSTTKRASTSLSTPTRSALPSSGQRIRGSKTKGTARGVPFVILVPALQEARRASNYKTETHINCGLRARVRFSGSRLAGPAMARSHFGSTALKTSSEGTRVVSRLETALKADYGTLPFLGLAFAVPTHEPPTQPELASFPGSRPGVLGWRSL